MKAEMEARDSLQPSSSAASFPHNLAHDYCPLAANLLMQTYLCAQQSIILPMLSAELDLVPRPATFHYISMGKSHPNTLYYDAIAGSHQRIITHKLIL